MQVMNMTGYVLFWYLLGVKLTWGHAHKTSTWYLLKVTFKKSDEHPCHFYMGVPTPGNPKLDLLFCRSNFGSVLDRFQNGPE